MSQYGLTWSLSMLEFPNSFMQLVALCVGVDLAHCVVILPFLTARCDCCMATGARCFMIRSPFLAALSSAHLSDFAGAVPGLAAKQRSLSSMCSSSPRRARVRFPRPLGIRVFSPLHAHRLHPGVPSPTSPFERRVAHIPIRLYISWLCRLASTGTRLHITYVSVSRHASPFPPPDRGLAACQPCW